MHYVGLYVYSEGNGSKRILKKSVKKEYEDYVGTVVGEVDTEGQFNCAKRIKSHTTMGTTNEQQFPMSQKQQQFPTEFRFRSNQERSSALDYSCNDIF